jgi:hypothetical protein
MYYSNRYMRIKEMFRGGMFVAQQQTIGGGGHGGRGGLSDGSDYGEDLPSTFFPAEPTHIISEPLMDYVPPRDLRLRNYAAPEETQQPCVMDLDCPSGGCSMWGTCL